MLCWGGEGLDASCRPHRVMCGVRVRGMGVGQEAVHRNRRLGKESRDPKPMCTNCGVRDG
jgi:hypothetical protein